MTAIDRSIRTDSDYYRRSAAQNEARAMHNQIDQLQTDNTKLRAENERLRAQRKDWIARLRAINAPHVKQQQFWDQIAQLISIEGDDPDE